MSWGWTNLSSRFRISLIATPACHYPHWSTGHSGHVLVWALRIPARFFSFLQECLCDNIHHHVTFEHIASYLSWFKYPGLLYFGHHWEGEQQAAPQYQGHAKGCYYGDDENHLILACTQFQGCIEVVFEIEDSFIE